MTPAPSPDPAPAPGPPRPRPLPDWVPPAGAGHLVVAIDTGDLDEALRLRDRLIIAADGFKIGKELFTAAGPRAVDAFLNAAKIFLDLKFHDIPATVAGAVRAAAALGANLVDIHASGGRPMIEAASAAANEPLPPLPPGAPPRGPDERAVLLGVTVLTHFDRAAAAEVFPGVAIDEQVRRLAALSLDAGADGVVASAEEAPLFRERFGDSPVLVVPGVRPSWAEETHDQRRVATPAEAARGGANYLVVGRVITRSRDPYSTAMRIRDEADRAGY